MWRSLLSRIKVQHVVEQNKRLNLKSKSISHLFQASFQKVIVFNLSLKGKQVDLLWCKFSVDFSSVDIFSDDFWPFCSSIFDDIFSASQIGPIFIVLLFCKYRRILSATRHRPRPIWTRHIGHRSVFGRHFSHTIWPFTHWYVCVGDAGVYRRKEKKWYRAFSQFFHEKVFDKTFRWKD